MSKLWIAAIRWPLFLFPGGEQNLYFCSLEDLGLFFPGPSSPDVLQRACRVGSIPLWALPTDQHCCPGFSGAGSPSLGKAESPSLWHPWPTLWSNDRQPLLRGETLCWPSWRICCCLYFCELLVSWYQSRNLVCTDSFLTLWYFDVVPRLFPKKL